MKKIIVFICIFMLVGAENTLAEVKEDDLINLISIAEKSDILIELWKVTLKETMPIVAIKNHIKKLEKTNKILMEKSEKGTIYTINNGHNKAGLSISFHGVIPFSSQKGEFIIEISGHKWDEKTHLQYKEVINTLFHIYFSKNVHTFACLQGQSNGIIKKTILLREMKETLHLKHVKTQLDNEQNDKEITEIYGYTPLWSKKLMISDQPMNTHITYINEENRADKIIIGTPILINEY